MAPYCPPDAHYAHISMDGLSKEQLNYITGVKGRNLYKWTSRYGLKYMWMDFENKRLELWGAFSAFENGALPKVVSEIEKKM